MDPDSTVKEPEDGLVIGAQSWNPQDSVPAALHLQPVDGRRRGELPVKLGKIGRDAGRDLLLDDVAPSQPLWQRMLHGCVHREECIGNYLQPVHYFVVGYFVVRYFVARSSSLRT